MLDKHMLDTCPDMIPLLWVLVGREAGITLVIVINKSVSPSLYRLTRAGGGLYQHVDGVTML